MLRFLARYLLPSAILLQTVLTVSAVPIDNVEDWAKQFQEAASTNDIGAMKRIVETALDKQIKADAVFENLDTLLSNKHVLYVEQFNNQSLGTFMKRVNVAVIYKETAIFYAFEFVRGDGGWRILGVGTDGNVNRILSRQWPP